jgi:hypothetical protein
MSIPLTLFIGFGMVAFASMFNYGEQTELAHVSDIEQQYEEIVNPYDNLSLEELNNIIDECFCIDIQNVTGTGMQGMAMSAI